MKLTIQGCRQRQRRLVELLDEQGLDGAVIGQREHIYYFCGHLHNGFHAAALLVRADGTAVLAGDASLADATSGLAVDDYLPYPTDRLFTMHNRQIEEAVGLNPFTRD